MIRWRWEEQNTPSCTSCQEHRWSIHRLNIIIIENRKKFNWKCERMDMRPYPIEYGSPTLHGNTLEHGQHGETDVVEGSDAEIGPFPFLQAQRWIVIAYVTASHGLCGVVGIARRCQFAFGQDLVYKICLIVIKWKAMRIRKTVYNWIRRRPINGSINTTNSLKSSML